MKRSTISLLLLVLAACGGPAQSSQPPAAPSAAPGGGAEAAAPAESATEHGEEKRLVSLLEGLAAELPPAGACDAYAAALGGWMESHAAEVRELTRQTERGSDLERAELDGLQRRLEGALEAVLEGADACTESEPAQAAFADFDDMMLGG